MNKTTRLIVLSTLLCTGALRADEPVFPNSDFERGDLSGWTSSGGAFQTQPTQGDNPAARKRESAKAQGAFWVGTFEKNPKGANTPGKTQGDTPTGMIVSQEFPVAGKYLTFRIGGGRKPLELYVNVIVDGQSVARLTGNDSETMKSAAVDMRPYAGKTARIEIVDNAKGGWGHINVDDFRWSNDDALLSSVGDSFPLTVDKKYLLIPVANPEKIAKKQDWERLVFLENGKPVQSLNVFFPENPEDVAWWAAYPMERYAGKSLTIAAENIPPAKKEMFRKIALSDTVPTATDDYREPYRNQFHYSPRRGWNNDVNGLFYRDGVWHLFYQYNPLGIYWQNMHWGHATSTDLVHWDEQGIALFQNGFNDMMYSGTGAVDTHNTLGVDPSGKGADVLVFTSTGRGECVSYSLDGGKTWTELPENPVLQHHGRDPYLFWHAPTKQWIMVLYDEQKGPLSPAPQFPFRRRDIEKRAHQGMNQAIYASPDLRHWTLQSRFAPPDRSSIYECPALFELPVQGEPGKTKWVTLGVQQYYHIGDFDGKTFTPDQEASFSTFDGCRAAIVFDNAPDGRKVMIGWTGQGWETMRRRYPDLRFSQGFTLPLELSMRRTADGLRLFAYPVKEIDALRGAPIVDLKNPTFEQAKAALEALNGPQARHLDIVLTYKQAPGAKLSLTDLGVGCDTRGEFMVEKDGQPFTPAAEGELRMLVDSTIVDCFLDGGRRDSFKRPNVDKLGATELALTREGDVQITSLKVYPMGSIWPQ